MTRPARPSPLRRAWPALMLLAVPATTPAQLMPPGVIRRDPPAGSPWIDVEEQRYHDWSRLDEAGWRALSLGWPDSAEREFHAAIRASQKVPQLVTSRHLARTYAGLALALHQLGRDRDALPLARWALAVREKAGPKSEVTCSSLGIVAEVELGLGRPAEAEALLRRAVAIAGALEQPNATELLTQLNRLGRILHDQRRYAEAESFLDEAEKVGTRWVGLYDPDTIEAAARLGLARFAQGKDDAALPLLARAASRLAPRANAAPSPLWVPTLLAMADIQGRRDAGAEAEAGYRKALDWLKQAEPAGGPATRDARRRFADWLERAGRPDEAKAFRDPAPPAPAAIATPAPATPR